MGNAMLVRLLQSEVSMGVVVLIPGNRLLWLFKSILC